LLSAASSLFYTPQLFSEYIEPQPGIRGAVGYRCRRFSVAIESGYTQVIGTNPLVLDIAIVPLVFRASYHQNLLRGLGLRADLGTGTIYSTVIHYVDSIAYLRDELSTSRARTPLTEGRLYLTYSPLANIQLYAGGGIDLLDEVDGFIPLPVLQAGVAIQPFAFRRKAAAEVQMPAPLPPVPVPLEADIQPPPAPPVPAFERQIAPVYFPPNLDVMFEEYAPVVQEAGRLLRETEQTVVTLRGYAALFGTAGARRAISQSRAVSVRDYLVQQCGISEDRIRIEFYGADRDPELSDGSWESCRVVEMIIELNEEINEENKDHARS